MESNNVMYSSGMSNINNNSTNNNTTNMVQRIMPPSHNPMPPYAAARSKNHGGGSDEDGVMTPETSADDGSRKTSPWQRMKWTDNMVRLLIMIVFYIGDDADPTPPKKKPATGGAPAASLQKKGKWKSVSRAMMERGFSVSPQQCEDKFNDLNKRYKRVNDILGRGTACRVVENQALLDTMDHLSPKAKDEVRKLLNSKHLFFREMCAYHNSCGHAWEPRHPDIAESAPKSNISNEALKLGKVCNEDEEDDDEDEDEEDDDDNEADGGSAQKRARTVVSPWIQQIGAEMIAVLQDSSKGALEKVGWMKTKLVQLEEQRVGLESQTVEMEAQRLKWQKFSGNKEREMERERLVNERIKLENERMILLIRQKEMDLLNHHTS